MTDFLGIKTTNPPEVPTPVNKKQKAKSDAFTDKEGNSLGNFEFDIDGLFSKTNTSDQIRQKLLAALEYIKEPCNKFDNIKTLHNDFNKLLKTNPSFAELEKFNEKITSVVGTLSKETSKLYDDKKTDTIEYKEISQQYDLANTLKKLTYYLLREKLKDSSKDILPLSRSGVNKYPEKHSFFASALQETSSYGLSESIASQIKKGRSIENSILKVEDDLSNVNEKDHKYVVPTIATHRLSEHSTKDKENIPFEVLFINGSTYEKDAKDKFTKGQEKLASAIEKELGVKSHTLNQPSIEELEKKLIELSKKAEKNGGKLYIFYNGHGDKDGLQEGVSLKDAKKQGAEKFVFVLGDNKEKNEDIILSEDKIKELYKKHLKNVEVITIFDSCHGGAGITAIENNKDKFSVLA